IIDPMSQRVIALEALIRGRDGETPATYFDNLNPEELYTADLQSKKTAFAMASALGLNDKMLSVNLLPMTLVNKPNAVSFLINEIAAHGLVPEQIIVEFTESEVISRFDTFAQAV
ncbi:EAL domain-containing protein, partial [Escherichia coli]